MFNELDNIDLSEPRVLGLKHGSSMSLYSNNVKGILKNNPGSSNNTRGNNIQQILLRGTPSQSPLGGPAFVFNPKMSENVSVAESDHVIQVDNQAKKGGFDYEYDEEYDEEGDNKIDDEHPEYDYEYDEEDDQENAVAKQFYGTQAKP